MRINSVTPYTRSAFQPQKTSQDKTQNGHAVNFGNLTKPIDVFRKEVLAMKGVKEEIKKISKQADDYAKMFKDKDEFGKRWIKKKIKFFFKDLEGRLKFLQDEKELLVDIKNGVAKVDIIGDSRFAEKAKWRRDKDKVGGYADYGNITYYKGEGAQNGFYDVAEDLWDIRRLIDKVSDPNYKKPEPHYSSSNSHKEWLEYLQVMARM